MKKHKFPHRHYSINTKDTSFKCECGHNDLTSLVDTARGILEDFRVEYKDTNRMMAVYESAVIDKQMRLKARRARLALKKAVRHYNKTMENLRTG